MRLILSACLSISLVGVVPAAALTLSKKEWKAFSCTLKKARSMGNPEVADSARRPSTKPIAFMAVGAATGAGKGDRKIALLNCKAQAIAPFWL